MTLDQCRSDMIRLLESGDGYRFLSMADRYLPVCRHDHFIRLMAVRESIKLGLHVPAREALEEAVGIPGAPGEFGTLQRSLSAMSGDPVPWSSHGACFESNLQVLAKRGVDVDEIRDAWRRRERDYQLFRDDNGIDQVRVRCDGGAWRWVPFLGHHELICKSQPMPDGIGGLTPGPYLFDGLELGWYFQRVYEATQKTFLGFSCALFAFEPDLAAFAVVLHLHDWREMLADERVYWLLGDDSADRLRNLWDADHDLPFPAQVFTAEAWGGASRPLAVEIVQSVGARREDEIRALHGVLEEQYTGRDLNYWARRFDEALTGRGHPLRVLAAVSRHTTFLKHSMRDAQRAFENLGHECVVLTEKNDHAITGPLTYHRAIRDLDPDLFFVMDHLRPEFGVLVPRNLPILTWDQDQLPNAFTRDNMRAVEPHDFVVGCSKSKWIMDGNDADQFLNARVPTCPEQFGGDPLTDEEMRRYACDVSFVSHASQTPEAFHREARSSLDDPPTVKLLDTLFELMPGMLVEHRVAGCQLWDTILSEACRRCCVSVTMEGLRSWLETWYLWRLGDRMFRHEALEWVADWARRTGRSFRIYGHGWRDHPSLSEFAAGPAENGRELLCIYRASRINLQLMPAGFIHQRALDGLAAGGFFLSRLVPDDFRGRALRKLVERLDELNLTSTRELLDHPDPSLHSLLEAYLGRRPDVADPSRRDLLADIRLNAELLRPDEVFPQFEDIVFDSADQFAARAERFLGDEPSRRGMADRMRQVVINHFSYRPAMQHFLMSMAGYLKGAGNVPSR